MYKVYKNVPLPPIDYSSTKRKRKYSFHTMEVGDMTFMPGKTSATMSASVAQAAKELGAKFTMRTRWMRLTPKGWLPCDKNDDGAEYGLGVWRKK